MAKFGSDTFSGVAGTELSAHDASWAKVFGSSDLVLSDANRLRGGGGGTIYYYHGGTPGSADYTVSADLHYLTSAGSSAGVTGRGSASTQTFYMARYNSGWQLYKAVNGSFTQLGSTVAQSLSAGVSYPFKLEMIGDAIKLYKEGSGTATISATDSGVTDAGFAGVRFVPGTGGFSDTTGQHLDNFSADDVGGGGSDVDEALSGQGVSAAAGSVSVAVSASLSGAASTASAGTVGALASQALSGESVSSEAGTVGAALSVALSGQSVSVTQGVVTEEGDAGAVLSGVSSSIAQGAAVPAVSQTIAGQDATSAAGTLANSVTQALSGLALTVEQGDVSGAATGNVTAALLGLSLGVSLGDVTTQGGQLVRPASTGGFRYYAEVGGKRIHGTLEEIRRLVLQIAEQDAEATVEQAVPPTPAAVKIKAGRAVKRAMAKAAPEVAKQEVEQARESMQDAYQVAFRAAVSELAARRIEEDEEEAMLLML